MTPVHAARPWWRRLLALAANSFRLVMLHGLSDWRRDLRRTLPGIGSISLLLVVAGALGLLGQAIADVVRQQAADASALTVYLAADAAPGDVAALRARLAADPRVLGVTTVTPEQALAAARSRPGLGDLADLSRSNPFAGSLEVRVRQLADVGPVAESVAGSAVVDPEMPTSYDPQAYAALNRAALVGGAVGIALAALLLFVAYAVCANSVRSIALARREELALLRLLGARRWMLKAPFVVEGMMSGAVAGALAALLVAGGWWLSEQAAVQVFAAVLPGVGLRALELTIAAVLAAGLAVGSLSAAFGVRRLAA